MADTQDFILTTQVAGAVAVAAGAVAYSLPVNAELVAVYLVAGTAPAGADLIVNVRKNNVALFSGAGRPKIVAAATKGNLVETAGVAPGANVITPSTPSAAALGTYAAGDTVSVDVEQVGSGTAGSNLGVTLFFVEK